MFGDNLPKSRAEKAISMIDSADGVLVVGSSLMVLSAFRLAKYGIKTVSHMFQASDC
jgi:NAD-dependent SIR2 family protein deacetylase